MSFSKLPYEDLPDISGWRENGPKVLSHLLQFQKGPQLKWNTCDDCKLLATSEDLFIESSKANTLLCIQSAALPALVSQKRLDLMTCFLYCVDEQVRRQTIANLERALFNIEHYSDTFDLLKNTEEVLHDVLKSYLSGWRVLSEDNEQFFLTLVRLYCIVIGTLARVTLTSANHGRFEEFIRSIKSRGVLSIEKKKHKGLTALEEPLKHLAQYLKIKLQTHQRILTVIKSAESGASFKLRKESSEVQFTAALFVLQNLFQAPEDALLVVLSQSVVSVLPSTPLESKRPLLLDMVTHGIVHCLLKYLPEGQLPSGDVAQFSTEMINLLPARTKKNLAAIDILMFVKNSLARSKVIEIFVVHDRYSYCTDIVKTNMKIIEMLLSATTPRFKSPQQHPYAKEWRQCRGHFGKRPVLLNMYIPDQATHKADIYITDDSLKGQEPFNEITLLQDLPPHPNLIRVFAYSLAKLPYFYITENHLHGNLQLELNNKSINMDTFSPQQLRIFIMDAISAVEFLHSNKIVHRDLTAASFCLDEGREHVKLANLCLASQQDEPKRMPREKSGKVPTRWLAPESITGLIFSTSSDVYMFGCLMYEVLTHGCLPHSDITASDERILKLISERRKNLCQENCVSQDLSRIITECTHYAKEDRPDVKSLRQQLQYVIQNSANLQLPAGTTFPSLWKERLPSAEMKRGISFGHEDDGTLTSDDLTWFKRRVEMEGCASSSPEACEEQENIYSTIGGEFPDTEDIVPGTFPTYVDKLEDENLPGIPKFSVKHKERGEMIVYEQRMEAINLSFKYKQHSLSEYDMLQTLWGVASAISQLHERGWIHGDLGTECIWSVRGYDDPKIIFTNIQFMAYSETSDHNVRVRRDEEHVDKRSAPEVKNNGQLSKASDVFSFGFVMWDIAQAFYGRRPITSYDLLPSVELYWRFVTAREGDILLAPENCPPELYRIMKSCWISEQIRRPSIDQVAEDILNFIAAKETYMTPVNDDGYSGIDDRVAEETYMTDVYDDGYSGIDDRNRTEAPRPKPKPRRAAEETYMADVYDDACSGIDDRNRTEAPRPKPKPRRTAEETYMADVYDDGSNSIDDSDVYRFVDDTPHSSPPSSPAPPPPPTPPRPLRPPPPEHLYQNLPPKRNPYGRGPNQ